MRLESLKKIRTLSLNEILLVLIKKCARTDIKNNVAVTVADSLLEVKDSIIEALKAANLKLQQEVEKLKNRISELESDLNKKDQ